MKSVSAFSLFPFLCLPSLVFAEPLKPPITPKEIVEVRAQKEKIITPLEGRDKQFEKLIKKNVLVDVVQTGTNPSNVLLLGTHNGQTSLQFDGILIQDPSDPTAAAPNYFFPALSISEMKTSLDGETASSVGKPGGTLFLESSSMESAKNKIDLLSSWDTALGLHQGIAATGNAAVFGKHSAYHAAVDIRSQKLQSSASSNYGNIEKDASLSQSLYGKYLLKDSSLPARVQVQTLWNRFVADLDLQGGPQGDDPNSTLKSQALVTKLSATITQFERFEPSASYTYQAYTKHSLNPPDSLQPFFNIDDHFFGSESTVDLENKIYLKTWEFRHFFTHRQVKAQYQSIGTSLSDFSQNNLQLGVGAQGPLFRKLTTSAEFAGHQLSPNDYSFSGTVGLKYPMTENNSIFTRASRRINSPTLFQKYSSFGNNNLQPEKGYEEELGVELKTRGLKIKALGFTQQLENLIEFQGGLNAHYINKARANIYGSQIEINQEFLKTFSLGVQYRTFYGTMGEQKEELVRRPRHKTLSYIESQFFRRRLQSQFKWEFQSRRWDKDFSTMSTVPLSAFSLFHLDSSYAFSESWSVFGGLHNILNRNYETIWGYSQPGRSVLVGLQAQL